MNEDNLFPNHWGLQDIDSEILGMDFPKAPDFPDPMAEEGELVNYLSPFVREFEFTSIDAKEIVANYFYNLPLHTKGKKLSWIKEPECKLEIEPHKIFVFRDKDGKEGYHANEDELLYTIYVYISSSNSKLKKIFEFSENRIGDDEILFFVEDNIGDLSDQSMYARFGKKVNKELLLSMSAESMEFIYDKIPDFDESKLRELISNGVVKAKTSLLGGLVSGVIGANIVIGATGRALGWVSSMIGEGIEQLMIPESIWDSKGEDYFLDKEHIIESYRIDTSIFGSWQQKIIEEPQWKSVSVLLPSLTWSSSILLLLKEMAESYNMAVETIIDLIYSRYEESVVEADAVFYLSEQTAFLCGLWNGLIDFVAGIFKFTGDLLSLQFDIAKNYKEILEAIDDFREAWSAFSLIDFFKTAWKLQIDFYKEIIKFLVSPDPREAYNFDRFAYFAGFGTAFIASLFIPLANISRVSSIAKYSKFIPEDFVNSLNIAKVRELKGSKALVNWLEEIATLLDKKGDDLYQELKKLMDKVVEWLKKNSKKFESTLSKIKDAFFKEGKTEEYFRKIEKKLNLAGEQILSTYDLKKLRRLLKETFDVPLELVDQNPKLKGKLKDWKFRRVAGSFNMVEGTMYLRKSVTAYTVQHEMFHMKLWYKMTKEFPELQPLFQKTLGRENVLFHEEYVLSEFMKDSSKWLEADLLNDLENINGLRTQKGLPTVDLEYYKKWNIEEELLKFE